MAGTGGEAVLDCSTMLYPDADGDGYGDDSQPGVACETPGYAPAGDCDDADFYDNPGLSELCDGIDNDCNPDTPDVCPLNCLWDHPQGRRLHLFCWYPTQTWAAASELCASQGMRLVKIESQSEQDYVLSWHDPDNSWLGGSDAGEEGTWKWQDGSVFWEDDAAAELFADWAGGEPSNSGSSGNEDCLLLNGTATPDSWWNDHDCNDPLPFTCERY
jgi:hypothetical protein